MTIDDLGKAGGSLRQFLKNRGVTEDDAVKGHIQFILDTEERTGRRLDLSRYRVNPDNPNAFPALMG